MKKVEFIRPKDAAALISDRASVCVNGFLMANAAEELFCEVEHRFLETNHPQELKLMFTGSVGDGSTRGINHFAHEGLIRECFGAHYGVMRTMSPLILKNKIKAYNLPQGVIIQLYRAMGAHQPGIITHVGLGTFVDPGQSSGKLNEISDEDFVKKVQIDGKDYLFYKTPENIDFALLRGTEADEDGNISIRKEGLKIDGIPIATATHNCGGKVIVQVERIVRRGTLDPKSIHLPRTLVDYVCVAEHPENHMQSAEIEYDESLCTNRFCVAKEKTELPLTLRKVIARRCALLLTPNDYILNYGIGVPEMVGAVLDEEGVANHYLTTVESGIIGGCVKGGPDFGVASSPEAIVTADNQFDFYQGGGIDAAFLGLAQSDKEGNINVSKFGSTMVTGSGGFIDIAQNAKKVVFCGTFFVKGTQADIKDGHLKITQEGTGIKFLDKVEQITYSGTYARTSGQTVYAVTERAVFHLTNKGWMLEEIAPGVDLEKDILTYMAFKPIISSDLKTMDACIFDAAPMNLQLRMN